MSSCERPIGAAKGKQSDTVALCQPPPPLLTPPPLYPPPQPQQEPRALVSPVTSGGLPDLSAYRFACATVLCLTQCLWSLATSAGQREHGTRRASCGACHWSAAALAPPRDHRNGEGGA